MINTIFYYTHTLKFFEILWNTQPKGIFASVAISGVAEHHCQGCVGVLFWISSFTELDYRSIQLYIEMKYVISNLKRNKKCQGGKNFSLPF